MVTEYDQPPELDGMPEDSRMLPPLAAAAARVAKYISVFGDGCMDVIDDTPLYARDLEVLVQHVKSLTPMFGMSRAGTVPRKVHTADDRGTVEHWVTQEKKARYGIKDAELLVSYRTPWGVE